MRGYLAQAHAAEAAVREVEAAAGSGARVAVFRLDVGLDAKARPKPKCSYIDGRVATVQMQQLVHLCDRQRAP